jgi:hypothetical protein
MADPAAEPMLEENTVKLEFQSDNSASIALQADTYPPRARKHSVSEAVLCRGTK